jgi:hypothetical protein
MIVALLVLIVLILLCGAGAVKGWITNAFVTIVGFLAICLAFIWVGSFFGENGPMIVFMVVGGFLFVVSVIATINKQPRR